VRAEDDAPLAFGLSAVPRIAADRPKLAPAQAFAELDGRWVGLYALETISCADAVESGAVDLVAAVTDGPITTRTAV